MFDEIGRDRVSAMATWYTYIRSDNHEVLSRCRTRHPRQRLGLTESPKVKFRSHLL